MITWTDVQAFLTNPVVTFFGGSAITGALAYARRNLRTLEYTVRHDRVGITANDVNLGSVSVTWQGHQVDNLWITNIHLTNPTWQDFTNLSVTAYTREETILLNQYAEVTGTTKVLVWTQEFAALISVPAGQEATEAQLNILRHKREFTVPVLNRGQTIVIRFLTTVPGKPQGPTVWVDLVHPGVRVEYRKIEPMMHNVPVRITFPVGLLAAIGILIACALYVEPPWLGATIAFVVGAFAQSIGALLYKAYRVVKRVIVA
ncbi:MAG: hypothetical protein WA190_03195 [Usitatibacter sp.]